MPCLEREGRTRERNAKAIHVGCSTGDVLKGLNDVEELLDDIRAGSKGKGVAGTV